MSLNEIIKKIVKDFDKELPSQEKLERIFESIDQGHLFIQSLIRDRNNFERLKRGQIFDGHIDNDKRGWLSSHIFPITLEILNKEKVPGGAVTIPSMGGEKADLLVYHALCPELENFVSLIVWLNSQSSKNAWNQILELIRTQEDDRVLQFSEKCGIELPNKIHPSSDRDSKLVDKTLYESLYDWRFAYYLFDDGKTIMSHNSPINFRRVVLDQWTKEESFVGIRTTIGRLYSIKTNSLEVLVPSLYERPRKWEWRIDTKKFDKSNLVKNNLYFFQVYKMTGDVNIETHIRAFSEAEPVDIVGMFLAYSLYLLYLDKSRFKVVNPSQFELLFLLYYEQISKFCLNDEEVSSMNRLDWKSIQFGYTNVFTKWIDLELYIVPPVLRRYISKFDLNSKEIIIQKFDEALSKENHNCFTEQNVPYNKEGNRIFSSRQEMAKMNRFYDFVHFLIKSKRFILGIEQNPSRPHQREEEIRWIKNQIN